MLRLVRVPRAGAIASPNMAFEFAASAAPGPDGKLTIGDESRGMDANIPLKTLLTFDAGITRDKAIKHCRALGPS